MFPQCLTMIKDEKFVVRPVDNQIEILKLFCIWYFTQEILNLGNIALIKYENYNVESLDVSRPS